MVIFCSTGHLVLSLKIVANINKQKQKINGKKCRTKKNDKVKLVNKSSVKCTRHYYANNRVCALCRMGWIQCFELQNPARYRTYIKPSGH